MTSAETLAPHKTPGLLNVVTCATLSPPPSPPQSGATLPPSSLLKVKGTADGAMEMTPSTTPSPKKKRHPSFQLDKLFFLRSSQSTQTHVVSPPASAKTTDKEDEEHAHQQLTADLLPLAIGDSPKAQRQDAFLKSPREGSSHPMTAAENTEIANINAQADAQGRRVIFVPIANDPHSVSRQVAWLLESGILKPEEDLVVLAHVRAPYHKEPFYGTDILTDYSDVIMTSDESARQQARALVSTTAQFLAKHNIAVRAIIVQGESAHTIVRKAQELSASLVILGDNKGEGVFKRAIHGSTTDFCTHHLKCTIVIAK